MLNVNYTGDFAFIVSSLWGSPESEPMVANNISLGKFLNLTLGDINNFSSNNNVTNVTLDELHVWSQKISDILPEIAMLSNISNAIRLLDTNFQWNFYREYKERMMQNESCYIEKVCKSTFLH